MLIRLDRLLIKLLLCLTARNETVLRHVIAKAIGSLTVLSGGFEMCVAD